MKKKCVKRGVERRVKEKTKMRGRKISKKKMIKNDRRYSEKWGNLSQLCPTENLVTALQALIHQISFLSIIT